MQATKPKLSPVTTCQYPVCPDCGKTMGKAGFIWSGRNKRQLYRCNRCGRTTIKAKANPNAEKQPLAVQDKPSVPTPLDNHHRLCDGNYVFGGIERHCKLSEGGVCFRAAFPISCPKYNRTEWEALLPTTEQV